MSRRSRRRGRRSYGYSDDYSSPRRRRSGCLTPIRRFFHHVVMTMLLALGAILFFCIVLLIAFNFATFVHLLLYALYVGAGLAVLGLLYLVVRIIAAISHRISGASLARSKAKIERARVQQARLQVRQGSVRVLAQEAHLARAQQDRSDVPPRSRRTPGIGEDVPLQVSSSMRQSPYRTRNLRESRQEPLVRVLPALSSVPIPPEAPMREETDLERLGMPRKGQRFAYQDYQHTLKAGQRLLGIRKGGTARVSLLDAVKILLVLGSSGSGKSTTVLAHALRHVHDGGLLIVCDPGGFKPDSITQRMGSLREALFPGTTVALEHDAIMGNIERYHQELERRRRGADMSIPLLLLVDELNGLLMNKSIKKALTDLLAQFGQEARNYNLSLILCAQRASGLADIRNSMISFICHRCPEMEAEKILPARYARLAPQLGLGQTFVADANGDIDALQQVLLTPEDIAMSVRGLRFRTPPQTEPLIPRSPRVPVRHSTPPPQKGTIRRTQLVQAPDAPTSQPPPRVARSSPAGAGAIWGEAQPEKPPSPSPSQAEPMTEELLPEPPRSTRPPDPPPGRQDTFELLALRRKKKS